MEQQPQSPASTRWKSRGELFVNRQGSFPLRIQRLRRCPRPAVGMVKRRPFADDEADLLFAQFAQGGDGVADQGDDFLKLGKGDGESEIRFARQLDLVYTDREKH